MYGMLSTQAQAQAKGYHDAAGQQDAAYAFYGAQDPFAGTQDPFAGAQDSYTGTNFYQDPCSSENCFAAFGAQGGEEENEFAMYADGRAAQLGKHFRDTAFVNGYCFGLDDAVLETDFESFENSQSFPHPLPL
eukprot:2186052-Rhodomonas_salina.1